MDEIKQMFEAHHLFTFNIAGKTLGVDQSLVVQWVIILLVAVGCIFLTKNLKKEPGTRQTVLEIFVETIHNLVKETMGEEYLFFAPYIGTIAVYLGLLNMTGLIGIDPPTQDYSVAVGLALITFVVIQAFAIRKMGVGHYLLAYTKPLIPLTPINIMERVMLPVSLSLRLFGNILAASIIMKIVYIALGGLLPPITQLIIPVPLHIYFDLFDGGVQMVIFMMLTMINIKVIAEH